MEDNKITVIETAKILGLSRPMVQYLIAMETIKPLGKFAGAWILDRAQIEALKRSRT